MINKFKANPNTVINALNLSAMSCSNAMELLHNHHSDEEDSWLLAYHIMTSTALELYGKLKLAKRHFKNNENISELEKIFYKIGHELNELFSPKILGEDFLKSCKIKEVNKIHNPNIKLHSYEFILQDEEKPIVVYNPESIKYWFLSSKRSNSRMVVYQTTLLLKLCKSVQEAAYNSSLD